MHFIVSDDIYYEIEYDSSPFPGVGKFVLKSQPIEETKTDPDNALIFYKQGLFMKNQGFLLELRQIEKICIALL